MANASLSPPSYRHNATSGGFVWRLRRKFRGAIVIRPNIRFSFTNEQYLIWLVNYYRHFEWEDDLIVFRMMREGYTEPNLRAALAAPYDRSIFQKTHPR